MRRNPFAADLRPAPVNALAYFTDREGFQEAFARHAETPAHQDLSVLVFYGVGGIGKTTLLRKLCANLEQSASAVPFARFNLENISDQAQAYRDVLLRLRSDLESDFRLKFPRFDLALAVLLASEGGQRPALVKISSGLGDVFEMALEMTPGLVKAGAKIAGHQLRNLVQRSEPLERWVRHVGGTEAVLTLSEQFALDDQIILEELIRRFAQDLADQLPERPGKACRGVLFLDTYEALWTGRENSLSAQARLLDDWVRLLAEYLLGAGVLLVIAGRDRLGWGDSDPEWAPCLDQHLLGGVSAPDAQMFLARRGIGVLPPLLPDPLQAAILRCADTATGSGTPPSCHLLALALSADIVQNTRGAGGEPDAALFRGVPPAKMTSELATRFLKSLHNRNLELWVEALSLTPRFDEAAALALDAERQLHAGRAGWEQLRHYSFVTAQPDGFFRLHRTMREVLRARSSEAVMQTLHGWYARYWSERGETSLAFYHRWCLDPDGERHAWAERHTAALKALHMEEARSLLTAWAEVALDDDDRPLLSGPLWAAMHLTLGEALEETPLRPRATRLTGTIEHFESALSVFTEKEFPEQWAETQSHLGMVYLNLPAADRAGSLRQAEDYFHAALRVWTEHSHPVSWAKTQNNLGMACAYRPTGDRTENLQAATEFFKAAQRVWTQSEYPLKWTNMQNNIGCDFLLLPGGDRAENLRQAAACFEISLGVQTEEHTPAVWARTQHNLGMVYLELPEGDRQANLQKSLSHYQAALRVHTEDALPDVWAETQNSLGGVCAALSDDRQALAHYAAAQRVWTETDNPDRWAQAQSNRGKSLAKLSAGNGEGSAGNGEGRSEELLHEAIACFRDALRVHTEESFPDHWADEQKNLGQAFQSLAALEAAPEGTGSEGAGPERTNASGLLTQAHACFAAAGRGFRAVGLDAKAEEAEQLAQNL